MNDYNNGGTHIPMSTLIQYHKIGFKLIPIIDVTADVYVLMVKRSGGSQK
jgi:hypothetical protein